MIVQTPLVKPFNLQRTTVVAAVLEQLTVVDPDLVATTCTTEPTSTPVTSINGFVSLVIRSFVLPVFEETSMLIPAGAFGAVVSVIHW